MNNGAVLPVTNNSRKALPGIMFLFRTTFRYLFGKICLRYLFAGSELRFQSVRKPVPEGAGLVLGAKVPVILNSRSDSPMSRLASCAVAALHNLAGGKA